MRMPPYDWQRDGMSELDYDIAELEKSEVEQTLREIHELPECEER